jgi:benzodiazapine receptor
MSPTSSSTAASTTGDDHVDACDDRRKPHWVALVVSFVAVALVALIGGLSTDTGPGSWYQGLEQPAWNPPDAVFGPVWTLLYTIMAIAAWLVFRHGPSRPAVRLALGAYAVQLALNLAWTLVFFGAESVTVALGVIVALLVALLATIALFLRVERLAGLLLVPYALWVAYAAALNGAIVSLN